MVALSRRIRPRSRHFRDGTAEILSHPVRALSRQPYASTGGLLLLLVGIFGLLAIFPEIHRYIHVKRM